MQTGTSPASHRSGRQAPVADEFIYSNDDLLRMLDTLLAETSDRA
jgi:hypothetical protein